MLPSRLYRNVHVGIPPPLRSLLHPNPTLPPSVRLQLRLRLGVFSNTAANTLKAYSTTSPPSGSSDLSTSATARNPETIHGSSPSSPSSSSSSQTVTSQALPEKMERQMSITFTCTVTDCGTRSTHAFAKRSYERGIVLIECPGCHNRHLISDHLGWFKESTEGGKLNTVEDILRARGENVRRGHVDGSGGVVEYMPE
ncbi:DNL zinc finger-domain-containing protein [Lentinula aff. detonsa]|uniref:DNL zinc finger-domain-containing protein n=1 Tax=Lentinula aff. detonsa TaxID=2804958 RepID=A0AA38KGW7_9AGAR|nr:DNL zinc finger-domain-containing protein [Lentinula aff. detonsa]KAJ3801105.1 DNL zinc finger-domain-containing protein [Lentinula aff. detonsa]